MDSAWPLQPVTEPTRRSPAPRSPIVRRPPKSLGCRRSPARARVPPTVSPVWRPNCRRASIRRTWSAARAQRAMAPRAIIPPAQEPGAPPQTDHNLAEMAQQLEAALRRGPAANGRPPVTDPLAINPAAKGNDMRRTPAREFKPRAEPKFDAKFDAKLDAGSTPKTERRSGRSQEWIQDSNQGPELKSIQRNQDPNPGSSRRQRPARDFTKTSKMRWRVC